MKIKQTKRYSHINSRSLLIAMVTVLILAVGAVIALETLPYERIQTKDGTLIGKLSDKGETLVILVAGSGPTDMDGNSTLLDGRNDSLLTLSRALNQEGISTFRYDKRVAGRSRRFFKGKELAFDDFIEDLEAVVVAMQEKGYEEIYLAGHSQGSLLSMLVANHIQVAGVISLAGPGETIDQTLLRQFGEAYGMNSEQVKSILALQEDSIQPLPNDYTLSNINLRFISNWMEYDPTVEAASLSAPLLILQGTADSQVRIEDAQLLQEAQPEAKLVLIQDMNHLLKQVTDEEENTASYTDPSFPLHPELMESIQEFIASNNP